MRTRAQGASASVDVPYLASTYEFAENDLQTLLDAPTAELVRDFLLSVTEKAREHESLKSEKVRLEVELESAVRTADGKLKAQKSTLAKHAKETEELRRKLSEAETARETLASELDALRSSASGSSAETQTLRQRIETLEASNRDALALVESKSTEKDRVATELAEQHGKLIALRREVNQLEERNQALENAASSQRFREQSLHQEIELIKKNNEWYTTELQTRTQEHNKFRKERNARLAELQRELEDSTTAVESLKRSETSLRQRLDEVQSKADEAFTRIASLEEDMTRKEQSWKAELDGSKRLAELQAQNAATHRARLQEVQTQMDKLNEDAAAEIGGLQAEIEQERHDRQNAESKLADLELQVQRLEQQPRMSRPQTPMGNGGFDPSTPGRAGSPFGLTASTRKFGGKLPFSNTEYWSKYNEMQQDLEAERRRTEKLSAAVDEMVSELENRAPEYLEMRNAHDELEKQVLEFSGLLEDANSKRDEATKNAERYQSEAEARAREGEILRQQLRDLAAQVKVLTVEVQCREQGLDGMSADEKYRLELMARGELEDFQAENESFTNQFISQQLVIFHDVAELQKKNQQMRQMLREFGEKMEGDEARRKAAESEANAAEVEDLRQQVARYKDEVQATAAQIDSYVKERDMFRRMLQRRGDIPPGADMQSLFGQSVPPATPQRNGTDGVPQAPRSKDAEDLNKILKEQQTFFDQYRNESSQDRKMLKDQVDSLAREKSSLHSELAHWKSQKTLADERLQMLQANYNSLRNENSELQKRSNQMAESAAKQDLKIQQAAEELVEARSLSESLRHENANAKAEKDLWKRIEARLTEDNKSLMDERSRLNQLVTNLQNLQNERELSDSESRRRLQGRVEALEAEVIETKKKLEQETEDARQAALRREYQDGQSRTRIDDLVKSLGNVREELVAAKTTRDQLQTRVDELKIELRSAEERVAALQPRPTPRSEPQQNGHPQEEDELPTEQRQALEISDLRRDLELAKNELESARQQVEQYKAIAQGTEDELASFNETADQFKEEVDRQIAEKDARIAELQQRIDDISAEMASTHNELSELRIKQDSADRLLNEQKSNFENEIARLNDDAERHAEEKRLYQEDLKAQADIAQQAQQSYEDELLKHAEAAKNLKSVREEYNALRTEVAGVRAEAEAAKSSLERQQESWNEQREKFEQELDEMKKRRHDVDEQNRLLHQQMESFSAEVAALRSGRASSPGQSEANITPTSGLEQLQELINYLRKDKEIVEVQYELKMQEAKRLEEQLEYASTQLEDTRQKLADERRQALEKSASEGSTTKLMQTIEELNLHRESAATLRSEARQARERLEEKSKEVERLFAELEPLKGRVGELEGELEGKQGELKLLQDDRDHWRERTQNIISKYDRVDPAELEEMKTQLAALMEEKERLEAEQAPLREQIEGIDARVQEAVGENTKLYEDRLERFKTQAKEQNRKQNSRIKDGEAAVETAKSEMTKIGDELEALKKELEETKTALIEAQGKVATTQDLAAGEVSEGDQQSLQDRATTAEASAAEQTSRAESLEVEIQTLRTRVTELEGEVFTLQEQLERALQGEEGEISPNTETLDKLKQELATAQQEVETLRLNAANSAPTTTNAEPADGKKSVAEQVADEVAKLRAELEQQHELSKQQMEADYQQKIQRMRESLNTKLREEREKIRNEVAEKNAELQKVQKEYEGAIAKLNEEHQAQLDKLSQDGAAAIAKVEVGSEQTSGTGESGQASIAEPTDEQVLQLMQTSPRIKGLLNSNINKRVDKEMEKARKTIAEKNEEIAKLKESAGSATDNGDQEELKKKVEALEAEVAELKSKLEAAEAEKTQAVRIAVEQATKKGLVQQNMLGLANAKVQAVKKAVQETPDKSVKEVWEVADKAKPPPKATPAAPSASSPAQKPVATSAPSPKPETLSTTTAAPVGELTEEQRLLERQKRFGTGPTATSFGQPSAPANTGTSLGQSSQPSATGALGQPARRPSMSNIPGPGTTPATLRGALGASRGGIPRGGAAAARGGGIHIQGAASAQQPPSGIPSRGGLATGIPRGGAPNGPRGGARGGLPRGGGNAGQKRPHEGGEGGDGKRQRGGGGSGGS